MFWGASNEVSSRIYGALPKILRRAPNSRSLCLQALRGCLLLHFAAADLEDARGSADGARRVYEGLVAGLVAKSDAAAEGQEGAGPAGGAALKVTCCGLLLLAGVTCCVHHLRSVFDVLGALSSAPHGASTSSSSALAPAWMLSIHPTRLIVCRAAVPRAGRTGLDPVHAVGAPRGRRHRLPQALRALPQVARLPLAGAGKLLGRVGVRCRAGGLPAPNRKRHGLLPMSCTRRLLLACLPALGTMGGCMLLFGAAAATPRNRSPLGGFGGHVHMTSAPMAGQASAPKGFSCG